MSVVEIAKLVLAEFGLGLAAYAAIETEPKDIARRAGFGVLWLGILSR